MLLVACLKSKALGGNFIVIAQNIPVFVTPASPPAMLSECKMIFGCFWITNQPTEGTEDVVKNLH